MFGLALNPLRPRRRRRAPAAVIVFMIVGFVAYDELSQFQQRKEAWQGTVQRTYEKKRFLSRRGSPKHFMEVRDDDGTVHTARIWSSSLWKRTRPGDWVVKSAGQLDPQ